VEPVTRAVLFLSIGNLQFHYDRLKNIQIIINGEAGHAP
jgi:hypothetical protein